jgi:hypothetical protein
MPGGRPPGSGSTAFELRLVEGIPEMPLEINRLYYSGLAKYGEINARSIWTRVGSVANFPALAGCGIVGARVILYGRGVG